MKYRMMICLVFVMAFIKVKANNDPVTVSSTLKAATIFRSGAELQHTVTVALKAGSNEVVIENISNSIDVNSIQINTPAAVTILGVDFSNNYLTNTTPSPRIKLLTDSLNALSDRLDKTGVSINIATDLVELLKTNRSNIKNEHNGMTVAELIKLMEYCQSKSTELQNDLLQLKNKQQQLRLQSDKVSKQIKEEESKNVSTSGRILLQVSATLPGSYNLSINYISNNAYWTPFYDIRVDDIKSPMKIVYKAKITQFTGIDWKQVKLSLSTSQPTQWGDAPLFKSWYLGYIDPINVMNRKMQSMNSIPMLSKEKGYVDDEVVVTGYGMDKKIRGAASLGGSTPLYIVNGAEMSAEDFAQIPRSSIKDLQVLKDASSTAIYGARASNGVIVATLKSELEDYISVTENALNLTFDIDMPYDIATSGKAQSATLKTLEANSLYKYYAVPKLDMDAYLLAEVREWEKLNLLPGEANIILEGTYVGKSFIDPNIATDTLNLTLGKDKRVIIKRDKISDVSSSKSLSGTQQRKITYEITVRNNKKEPIALLLKDQFPLSNIKDIEVELLETSGAGLNNEVGVMNWTLDLAPGEIKKVKFTYNVKYPKGKVLNLK